MPHPAQPGGWPPQCLVQCDENNVKLDAGTTLMLPAIFPTNTI
jgi:hypothetical protein